MEATRGVDSGDGDVLHGGACGGAGGIRAALRQTKLAPVGNYAARERAERTVGGIRHADVGAGVVCDQRLREKRAGLPRHWPGWKRTRVAEDGQADVARGNGRRGDGDGAVQALCQHAGQQLGAVQRTTRVFGRAGSVDVPDGRKGTPGAAGDSHASGLARGHGPGADGGKHVCGGGLRHVRGFAAGDFRLRGEDVCGSRQHVPRGGARRGGQEGFFEVRRGHADNCGGHGAGVCRGGGRDASRAIRRVLVPFPHLAGHRRRAGASELDAD